VCVLYVCLSHCTKHTHNNKPSLLHIYYARTNDEQKTVRCVRVCETKAMNIPSQPLYVITKNGDTKALTLNTVLLHTILLLLLVMQQLRVVGGIEAQHGF